MSVVGSSEPPGAACPAGGSRFDTGGVITYACNGASGPTYTAGPGLSLAGTVFSAAFTSPGGDTGTASTVARSDHRHDARYPLRPLTTVLVSPVGTPEQNGTALLDAVNGITDSSATRPYLVKIEPGIYDLGNQALVGKAHVDLEGSGRATTVIRSSSSFCVVQMPGNSELRELAVSHVGGPAFAVALILGTGTASGPITARRIAVSAVGGSTLSTGVTVNGTPSGVLEDAEVSASGPDRVTAIQVNGALVELQRVRITASGGTGATAGVRSSAAGSTLLLSNVTISATSTTGAATAVFVDALGRLVLRQVDGTITAGAEASGVDSEAKELVVDGSTFTMTGGGSSSRGLQGINNDPASSATVQNSRFTAVNTADTGNSRGLALTVSSATVMATIATARSTGNASSADGAIMGSTSWWMSGSALEAISPAAARGLVGQGTSGRFDSGRIVATTPIQTFSGTTRVGVSLLSGGPSVQFAGTLSCVNSYSGNNAFLTSACNLP